MVGIHVPGLVEQYPGGYVEKVETSGRDCSAWQLLDFVETASDTEGFAVGVGSEAVSAASLPELLVREGVALEMTASEIAAAVTGVDTLYLPLLIGELIEPAFVFAAQRVYGPHVHIVAFGTFAAAVVVVVNAVDKIREFDFVLAIRDFASVADN